MISRVALGITTALVCCMVFAIIGGRAGVSAFALTLFGLIVGAVTTVVLFVAALDAIDYRRGTAPDLPPPPTRERLEAERARLRVLTRDDDLELVGFVTTLDGTRYELPPDDDQHDPSRLIGG